MRRTLASLLPLLCLIGSMMFTNMALAKVYKWVDENGATHYSSTPPPTGDFKTIKGPSKPAVDPEKAQSDINKRIEAFNKRKEDAAKAEQEAADAASKKAENQKNCAQAKKNLNLLQTKVRLRIKKEDGSQHYQTDKERNASIKRAQEQIKSFCK